MFSVTFADILSEQEYANAFEGGLQNELGPSADLVDDFSGDLFDSLIDDADLVFPETHHPKTVNNNTAFFHNNAAYMDPQQQLFLQQHQPQQQFTEYLKQQPQTKSVPVRVDRSSLPANASRTSAVKRQRTTRPAHNNVAIEFQQPMSNDGMPFMEPVDDILSELAARVSPVDEQALRAAAAHNSAQKKANNKRGRDVASTDDDDGTASESGSARGATKLTAGMSAEERAELMRKRNREHARSTRRRKKLYVECLKRQVAELMEKQKQLEAQQHGGAGSAMAEDDDECQDDAASLRKEAVLKFMRYTTTNVTDLKAWAQIVDESFTLLQPRTPFRGASIGEYVGNNRRIQGVTELMRDTTSITAMLQMINARVQRLPGQPEVTIRLEYDVEPSDILVVGEKLMCHWKLTTVGLTHCGHPTECCVDGMMKCTFNSKNLVTDMELTYDVMAFTRQLQQYSLIEWSVIQNGLSLKHSEPRRETDKKSGAALPSISQAFGHLPDPAATTRSVTPSIPFTFPGASAGEVSPQELPSTSVMGLFPMTLPTSLSLTPPLAMQTDSLNTHAAMKMDQTWAMPLVNPMLPLFPQC